MAYQPTDSEPKPGETWKYAWLPVRIEHVGPKTVTYTSLGDRSNGERARIPKERFMRRFHRTNMPVHTDGAM